MPLPSLWVVMPPPPPPLTRRRYEARDVFVDVAYANQLRRLAGCGGGKAPLPQLPQLYLDGACVGGQAEIEDLNERGALKRKLEAFQTNFRGVDAEERACADCGGKRFVICTECSGTRKGRTTVFGSKLKCSNCNENGLMACPTCNQADAKIRQEARIGLSGEGGVVESVKAESEEQRRARQDAEARASGAVNGRDRAESGVVESVKEMSEEQKRARADMKRDSDDGAALVDTWDGTLPSTVDEEGEEVCPEVEAEEPAAAAGDVGRQQEAEID